MGDPLEALGRADREAVLTAIAAVEIADAPVPGATVRALMDPALREVMRASLARVGRTLVEVGRGEWISAYDDTIADHVAALGIGILRETDRAVLALVLLRTIAIPRARGQIEGTDWTVARPTSIEELALNRTIPAKAIRASVRRLRDAAILRPGHRPELVPGPQFLRLTEARSSRIFEELVLLCRPHGVEAQVITRRRRLARLRADEEVSRR